MKWFTNLENISCCSLILLFFLFEHLKILSRYLFTVGLKVKYVMQRLLISIPSPCKLLSSVPFQAYWKVYQQIEVNVSIFVLHFLYTHTHRKQRVHRVCPLFLLLHRNLDLSMEGFIPVQLKILPLCGFAFVSCQGLLVVFSLGIS
jgi:hypothetical protein